MRQFIVFSALAAMLAAASPVLADDGVQVGAIYRDVVPLKTYGSPQVPLPPGDWKLVALTDSRSDTNNIRIVRGNLIQTRKIKDGEELVGRVSFYVPDAASRGGWAMTANCSRKNLIGIESSGVGGSSFNCRYINAVSMVRSSKAGDELNRFYDYVEANKIKKPATGVYAYFTISDGRSYMNLEYLFNPDIEKIRSVVTSAWHEDRYKEDPKREAYIGNLKSWAQGWASKVEAGFKGRLPVQASAR